MEASLGGTGALHADMEASMRRTRKLATRAADAVAEQHPDPEECGKGLQWESVSHWEEFTTQQLMALGGAALGGGDARTANACYGRAYEIASQPAPPRKDPFDPDPEPPRRAKWWPTEVQCKAALCVGQSVLVVGEDPVLLAAGTVAGIRSELAGLDALAKEVTAKVAVAPTYSWLLYNVSWRIYHILLDVLARGLAGPALSSLLPPLLWVAAAVDASSALCTAEYAGWRVQLATAACRAFDGIGQPDTALRFCQRLSERLEAVEAADEAKAALTVPPPLGPVRIPSFCPNSREVSIALSPFTCTTWSINSSSWAS